MDKIGVRNWEAESFKIPEKFPKIVLIDTVNYCNLRCSMCGRQKMTRKGGIMEMRLYQKIIDEIAEIDNTVRIWDVFFGDPFILKDKLYPFISYAKSKGLKDVVLNSNGNLMDEKAAYGIIESGLDAIYIGIDGISPETYSKLRIGGNYEKVVGNVQFLLELKQKLGVDKPKVYVQFVEMEENRDEKEDFIKYWISQGVIVKIRPLKVSWAGTVESKSLSSTKKRHPCYWIMKSMNILYDGQVCLCAVDYDGKFTAGSVAEKSIQSIWQGPFRKVQQTHLSGDYASLPDFCRDCLDWQAGGGDYYIEP